MSIRDSILGIFYCEFDIYEGTKLVHQAPEGFLPQEIVKNISEVRATVLKSVRVKCVCVV